MLSLQLKSGEYLTIGEDIAVQIFQTGSSFRVAVKAPREIPIVRGEVLERQGEDRPDGLHVKPSKRPSQQARNARRLQSFAEKKERRAQEMAGALAEVRALLEKMDGLAAGGGGHDLSELREEAQALRGRLERLESAG